MLQLYEYDLPFRSAFRTGSGTFKSRQGILLRFTNGETDIVTEASPLPGFSKETFSDVRKVLLDRKKEIEHFFYRHFTLNDICNLLHHNELSAPSIQFALSFLGLEILEERTGKTMYDLLETTPPENIAVNDVIAGAPVGEMAARIENSVQKGFKVIKVKAPHPVDELAALLRKIQNRYTHLRFRLDANQSWPESSIAKNSDLLRGLSVEYIEEPKRMETLDEIGRVRNLCSVPVALDESVTTTDYLGDVLNAYPDVVVILKPMLLGNILKIRETISRYRSSCKHVVCTTTLESGVGRSMVATTTSLTGDPDISHGLNTGHLFAGDLLPDFEIKNGFLKGHHKRTGTRSWRKIKTSYLKILDI